MRSGSWMLSDLCHQTGLLGQPEEYFRPDFRRHWSKEWGLDTNGSYAEYITSAIGLTSSPNGVFGVKMHAYQMDWFLRQLRVMWGADVDADDLASVRRWLPDPSFVRLKRRDVARQAISYYRAIHSTVWFELHGDPPGAGGPAGSAAAPRSPSWGEIRYLENGLVSQEAVWTRFFDRNAIAPLELVYEEVSADPSGALVQIFELLGMTPPAVLPGRSRLKKQADDTTEQWLQEYLRHRDSVTAVPPGPRPVETDNRGRPRSRPRGTTSAPLVYEDNGALPAELTPADYLASRVTWAQLVADLVIRGLPIGVGTSLVDALPGEGAQITHQEADADWRKGLTPLPPPPL
jgi:LPS sulfotransferase NodH